MTDDMGLQNHRQRFLVGENSKKGRTL